MITTLTAKFTDGAPGLYPSVPGPVYHGFKACSNSQLSDLVRSPAHCLHRQKNPMAQSKAMAIGDGSHTFLLEPHLLDEKYAVAQVCSCKTKEGKPCESAGKIKIGDDWVCGVHGRGQVSTETRQVLSQDDFDKCRGMRDAVHAHKAARDLLNLSGAINEASGLVMYEPENLLCKFRIDRIIPGLSVAIDLKSTRDARLAEFEKTVFTRGYYRQAGMYVHLAAMLGYPLEDFPIIAFENEAPFAVHVYRLKDDVIAAGWAHAQHLMHGYAECQRSGVWPGYGSEIVDIGLPAWAWKQLAQSGEAA